MMHLNQFTMKYFLQGVKQKGGGPKDPPFPFCEVNDGPRQIKEGFWSYTIMKWDTNSYDNDVV